MTIGLQPRERGQEMDQVTIGAILAAVAGGAGGALGSQVWAGVSALVRRPFHRTRAAGDTTALVSSGSDELAALEQSPADERLAIALAEVLLTRADSDSDFRRAFEAWLEQARQVDVSSGNVTNTISGGTQYGPVLQGRDFTGLTFGSPTTPSPTRPQNPLCHARRGASSGRKHN